MIEKRVFKTGAWSADSQIPSRRGLLLDGRQLRRDRLGLSRQFVYPDVPKGPHGRSSVDFVRFLWIGCYCCHRFSRPDDRETVRCVVTNWLTRRHWLIFFSLIETSSKPLQKWWTWRLRRRSLFRKKKKKNQLLKI